MHLRLVSTAALAAALSISFAAAQTTASQSVGGAGALGCQGSEDPPLLGDGTLATGDVAFAYDAATARLRVTVTNTSPVTAGVPNPLITDVWFNVPTNAIDGMTLVSQTAAGGATPAFVLTFDADREVAPSPNRANCFGFFSAHLDAGQGIFGGLANANADTIGAPPGSWVVGPIEFEFQLTGAGTAGLTASAIASQFSANAPYRSVNASLKFQSGANGGSGVLANGPECETAIWYVGEPRLGESGQFCIGGDIGCHACVWVSLFAGPTVIGDVEIPIGLPLLDSYDFGDFGPSRQICIPLTIPNDPNLIGLALHFVNVTTAPGNPQMIEFSDRFTLVISQ